MIDRIIFLSLLSVVFFFVNYIPIVRVFYYFGWSHALAVAIAITLLLPIGFLFVSLVQNVFSYYAFQVMTGIFASMLMFLTITLIVEFVRLTLKVNTQYLGYIIMIISGVLIVASLISGASWHTKEIIIETDKVKQVTTIVQLSDLHVYGSEAPKKFKKVLDRAMLANPDMILITGDLIDQPGKPPKDTFKAADHLSIPVIYSLGNHEYYVGDHYAEELSNNSKIQLMRNKAKTIKGVSIIAIDDSEDKAQVKNILPTIKRNESQFQVLMYHRPWGYLDAAKEGVDLMLTGHTHHGQYVPVHLLTRMQFKYAWGYHSFDQMKLYVSPGSGTHTWPLRLGAVHEITVFKLVPKK